MLEILQGINFCHNSAQEPIVTMWESINDFAKIRQRKYQSVPEYYERFCAMRDVNNSLGCSIYSHPGLIKVIAREKGENASALSSAKKNTYMKIGKDRMMAIHFLMGADKIKYDDTITSYKNIYLMNKRNNYPATLHNVFILMKGWTTTVNQSHHKVGVTFNTMGHDGNNTHGEVNIAKG